MPGTWLFFISQCSNFSCFKTLWCASSSHWSVTFKRFQRLFLPDIYPFFGVSVRFVPDMLPWASLEALPYNFMVPEYFHLLRCCLACSFCVATLTVWTGLFDSIRFDTPLCAPFRPPPSTFLILSTCNTAWCTPLLLQLGHLNLFILAAL